MAEEDSSQEKTEEATPRRLQKAKEDGQIPRSRELTTTSVLLMGTIGLFVFGGFMANNLRRTLERSLTFEREHIFDPNAMFAYLGSSFADAIFSLLPLFGVVAIAAILGPIALGGWMFSASSLAPKMNRISLLSGFKRMFSAKSLMELAKALGKVGVVIGVAYLLLLAMQSSILNLSSEPVEQALVHSLMLSAWAAIILSASTILIAMVDIPFQIHDHAKKLKMSRQDIKDEMKDTDGKPEVKSKIRQLQMQMSQKRMMDQVPEADVVITNPTHFSVALKYDPDTMETPVLLAKGGDHMALRIRHIAREHKIELIQAPVLARAIFHTTEVDDEIPSTLYVAVAQVLAYVFQLREFRLGRGERPDYPRNIEVPRDMQF